MIKTTLPFKLFFQTKFFRSLLLSFLAIGAGSISLAQPVKFAGETLVRQFEGRYTSERFGDLSIVSATPRSVIAWLPALNGFIQHKSDGSFFSWELGELRPTNQPRWIMTSSFGRVHLGRNLQTYGGWIYSEKFDWMRVERVNDSVFIWVPSIGSWVQKGEEDSVYSFEYGSLRELSPGRYESSIFGAIKIGDVDGWVQSELFGYLWPLGGGEWFWASQRNEWLGVLPNGNVWSTAEQRVLEVVPPLLDLIGEPGPSGGFVWKPKSEADHKLVVLISASLTDGNKLGLIVNENGEVVEQGRYTGSQHNGNREHYRFSRSGGGYGQNLYFVSLDRAGNRIHWPIPNGAGRYDY